MTLNVEKIINFNKCINNVVVFHKLLLLGGCSFASQLLRYEDTPLCAVRYV